MVKKVSAAGAKTRSNSHRGEIGQNVERADSFEVALQGGMGMRNTARYVSKKCLHSDIGLVARWKLENYHGECAGMKSVSAPWRQTDKVWLFMIAIYANAALR